MEKVDNRYDFRDWYSKQKNSDKVAVREMLQEEGGMSRQNTYHYTTGLTHITNLAPAVRRVLLSRFPDTESILFPEKEVQL